MAKPSAFNRKRGVRASTPQPKPEYSFNVEASDCESECVGSSPTARIA